VTELSKYDELAKKAGQGNKEAMLSLSEAIYEPLRNYVFRITLSEDLADDIVQETILEMYKIFDSCVMATVLAGCARSFKQNPPALPYQPGKVLCSSMPKN
jgi:hypothetical protein